MADVCFAIGTSTSDFKVAATVTVSGSTATFSAGQTGNIGVGCVIDYDSDNKKAYIKSKTSDTVWEATNATGGNPTAASGVTVNSIKRAFNNLSTAVNGSGTSGNIRALVGSFDLVTNTLRILIACYADGDDDSATTLYSGWITNSSYYLFLFTPKTIIDSSSPGVANTNQRHQGKWNGTGYKIRYTDDTDYAYPLRVLANHTKVFGLWVACPSGTWGYASAISYIYSGETDGNNCEIAYNLVTVESGANGDASGIKWIVGTSSGRTVSIHDNMVISESTVVYYGFNFEQEYASSSARQCKFYNNIFYGQAQAGGMRFFVNRNGEAGDYVPFVKNNYSICKTSLVSDVVFGDADFTNAHANFNYNASDDGTAGTSNNNQTITEANASLKNVSTGTEDLHINSGSSLINAGIGPSSDANVSTLDIDGDTRSGATCAIGADEIPLAGNWFLLQMKNQLAYT